MRILNSGLALGAMLIVSVVSAANEQEQQIIDRIKPVGEVCIAGDKDCSAEASTTAAASGPRAGNVVYDASCALCHAAGVGGAPILGNGAEWEARMEQGMDALVANAINGIRTMPPRGTCMDCSDEEMRIVVEYMVEQL